MTIETLQRHGARLGLRLAVVGALLGWGCSGFKPGDAGGARGETDASDASAVSDGSRSDDTSLERASGDDGEGAADLVPSDLDAAGSSGADATIDATVADRPSDGSSIADASVADTSVVDTSIVDASMSDTSHQDAAAQDAGATPPDVDPDAPAADSGKADSDEHDVVSMDAGPVIRPPIVIVGHITEFTPPVSIEGVKEIVAGPDGALWLPGGNGLLRVSTTGQFSELPIPVSDGGTSPGAQSLIVGRDGHFWFLGYQSVHRMTLQGVLTTFPLPPTVYPTFLAAGPDGNMWFSDSMNGTVDRMTMDGQVTAFALAGSAGPAPGRIIAGPDQNLWFVQPSLNAIGRMTTTGVFTEFRVPMPDMYPSAIAAGSDGNLWFNGEWNLIGRITPSGVSTQFALHGGDPGNGWVGQGVTAGPDGNMWFAQELFVSSVTPDGSTIKEYPCAVDCLPIGIAAGSDNMIWYVDERRHVVARVSP